MNSSAAIANRALSCHLYGGFSQSASGAEGSNIRISRSAFLKRTRLFAKSSQERLKPGHNCQSKSQIWSAATSGRALLETTTTIDVEDMIAEAPTLLELSSDFDWQKSATELREEAIDCLNARGEREMALERLGVFMEDCLHDGMFQTVLEPGRRTGIQSSQEELSVRIGVEDLRSQASLQAAEKLAKGVDSSFDWEAEVSKLHQTLGKQHQLLVEEKLWKTWEGAREGMEEEADRLHDEALKMQHLDYSCLRLLSNERQGAITHHVSSSDQALEKSGTWWSLGAALAGWLGSQMMDAIAAEAPDPSAISEAATKVAPDWVAPSVLAFPVVSYVLFTVYREKVNPYAKVTDWMFGLVAMAILGNILLIATVGGMHSVMITCYLRVIVKVVLPLENGSRERTLLILRWYGCQVRLY